MKKRTGISLLLLLLVSIHTVFAAYTPLYKTQTTTVIGPGVAHQEIRVLTPEGWVIANVLEVDVESDTHELKVLYDEEAGLMKGSTLSEMADNSDHVIGAINGDFFDGTAKTPLGQMISDGDLIMSGINEDRFNSFSTSTYGYAYFAYFGSPRMVVQGDRYSIPVDFYNKPYFGWPRAVLIDNQFASASPGKGGQFNRLEIVMEKGIVTDKIWNGAPQPLGEDTQILVLIGDVAKTYERSLSIGEKVEVEIYNKNFENLLESIGTGAMLVENGKPIAEVDQTHNIAGRHPRTAVGLSADKRTAYLVTVDGRRTYNRGLTQGELANLLVSIGAHEAANLDGGGSTEMVVRHYEDTHRIVNNPSDGSERRIYNGLGVALKSAPTEVADVRAVFDKDALLRNDRIPYRLTAFDAYGQPMGLKETVSIALEGLNGQLVDGTFRPTEVGEGTLRISHGDQTFKQTVGVEEAVRLDAYITPYGEVIPRAFTTEGHRVLLDAQTVTTTNLKTGEATHVVLPDDYHVKLAFDGLSYERKSMAREEVTLLHDFETQLGTFVSYPTDVTGYYQVHQTANMTSRAGALVYNLDSKADTRAAYVDFGTALKVNNPAKSLSLDVRGDYVNGHWLRAKIVDASGTEHTVDLAKTVDWTGLRTLTTDVSHIQAPFTVKRLYLVETDPNRRDAGGIFFDDLRVTQMISEEDVRSVDRSDPERDLISPKFGIDKNGNNLYNEVIQNIPTASKPTFGTVAGSNNTTVNEQALWKSLSAPTSPHAFVLWNRFTGFRDTAEEQLLASGLKGIESFTILRLDRPTNKITWQNGLRYIDVAKDQILLIDGDSGKVSFSRK